MCLGKNQDINRPQYCNFATLIQHIEIAQVREINLNFVMIITTYLKTIYRILANYKTLTHTDKGTCATIYNKFSGINNIWHLVEHESPTKSSFDFVGFF